MREKGQDALRSIGETVDRVRSDILKRRNYSVIFPGQGIQEQGMRAKILSHFEPVRRLDEVATRILGWSVIEATRDLTTDELSSTDIAQPVVFFWNHITYLAIERERGYRNENRPKLLAGNSLGHLNALVVARSMRFADGLELVQARGNAMQKACEENPGSLYSLSVDRNFLGNVRPSDLASLEKAIRRGMDKEILFLEADSEDFYRVVGVRKEDRRRFEKLLERFRKVRVKQLNAKGLFHSKFMEGAVDEFRTAVENAPIKDASIPVVSNVDGRLLTDAAEIKRDLVEHVTAPVMWRRVMETFVEEKLNPIEVGDRAVVLQMARHRGKLVTLVAGGAAVALGTYLIMNREQEGQGK